MLTVGSLFSGIGGLDLGLEQAGLRTLWQVERDGYALEILRKHWPGVPKYTDVREVGKHNLAPVDVIAGGFPCQDVSKGGNRAGIAEGTRSGLWFEFRRILSELRPTYAIVENVPGLLTRGMGTVLGELAEIGFDAEWDCLPAQAFGAPHLRDRVFILAHADGERSLYGEARRHAAETRLQALGHIGAGGDVGELRREAESGWAFSDFGWAPEPGVVRVVHGVPTGLDRSRIRGLGNAVCPPVAKWLGERLIEMHRKAIA